MAGKKEATAKPNAWLNLKGTVGFFSMPFGFRITTYITIYISMSKYRYSR